MNVLDRGRRFSCLFRQVVVLAVCLSLGVHWALLQAIAWTGMFLSYSQELPLVEAVAKTFDGSHPCSLCKAVESGQNDVPADQMIPLLKVDAVIVKNLSLIPPPWQRHDHTSWRGQRLTGAGADLFRPPRSFVI